jgi:NADH:ubiquinone oxidoreductase subunit 6 (subunit J)
MATVYLEEDRRGDYDLPDVCMKCGAPATVWKPRSFAWHPPWIFVLILAGLLVYVIVALVLTKRKRLDIPLCDAHKAHWLWRQLVVVGGLLVLLAVGFLAMILLSDSRPNSDEATIGGILCGGTVLGLLAWLVLAVVLQTTTIRPREITDDSITLQGVSPEFVQAYEDWLPPRGQDLDRAVRQQWRTGGARRRDHDDEDEPRVQRPPVRRRRPPGPSDPDHVQERPD